MFNASWITNSEPCVFELNALSTVIAGLVCKIIKSAVCIGKILITLGNIILL